MSKDKENNNVVDGKFEENENQNTQATQMAPVTKPGFLRRTWNFCVRHKTAVIGTLAFLAGGATGAAVAGHNRGGSSEEDRYYEPTNDVAVTETVVETTTEE